MRNVIKLLSLFLILLSISSCKQNTIGELDLSGQWKFQIDSLDLGISEKWFTANLSENVMLPGSTSSNDKGDPISLKNKMDRSSC